MKTTHNNCPQEMIPELISYLKQLERKGIKSLYLNRGDTPLSIETEAEVTIEAEPEAAPVTEAGRAIESGPETEGGPAIDAGPEAKNTTMPTPTQTDVVAQLAALEKTVLACTDCGLHEGRTNGVFGTGSPTTRVMFIGEGPGAEEDKQGKPFVGRSGQLLTKMIEAIELTRDEVYIANIVKCRPPNNRDPQEEEVRCCEQYLIQQIKLIRPRVICALGRVSAHWLLQTNDALGAMRKADNQYQDTPVLVTYHPAALLRNPNLKRDAWEDFKRLKTMIED